MSANSTPTKASPAPAVAVNGTPNKGTPPPKVNATPIPQATKKSESLVGDSASSKVKDDPVKALELVESRQKAINTNNVARVANSHLSSSDDGLHPLVSLKDGKPLPKFPETSRDIAKIGLADLNNLLNGLDADKTGSEAARRERLRVQIGLKPNPA